MKKNTSPSKVVIVPKPPVPTTHEAPTQADTVIKTNSAMPEAPAAESPEEKPQTIEDSKDSKKPSTCDC